MKTGKLIALISAILLIAASPDDGFEALWQKHKTLLLSRGVSKPMARQLLIWNDGQYYIGYCRSYIAAEDIIHWRTWWKSTPLELTDFGKHMLAMGDNSYHDGTRDASKRPFKAAQCQRLIDRWFDEMKNAVTDSVTASPH